MEKQNVTLSLPKDVLQKAKIMAIKENSSLSGFLTQILIEKVAESDEYQIAQRNFLRLMESSPGLGTEGQITWTRDELHER